MDRTRIPYVGAGADGARRAAQIDLDEADTLDQHTDEGRRRYNELTASAAAWVVQADQLEAQAARLTDAEWSALEKLATANRRDFDLGLANALIRRGLARFPETGGLRLTELGRQVAAVDRTAAVLSLARTFTHPAHH